MIYIYWLQKIRVPIRVKKQSEQLRMRLLLMIEFLPSNMNRWFARGRKSTFLNFTGKQKNTFACLTLLWITSNFWDMAFVMFSKYTFSCFLVLLVIKDSNDCDFFKHSSSQDESTRYTAYKIVENLLMTKFWFSCHRTGIWTFGACKRYSNCRTSWWQKNFYSFVENWILVTAAQFENG